MLFLIVLNEKEMFVFLFPAASRITPHRRSLPNQPEAPLLTVTAPKRKSKFTASPLKSSRHLLHHCWWCFTAAWTILCHLTATVQPHGSPNPVDHASPFNASVQSDTIKPNSLPSSRGATTLHAIAEPDVLPVVHSTSSQQPPLSLPLPLLALWLREPPTIQIRLFTKP